MERLLARKGAARIALIPPGQPAPLRADGSRYVQNSVAHWLNDAVKTQPAWVREVCGRWSRGKVPAATLSIVRRAQRSLREG